MTWLMEILNTYLEEQLLIKYYVIKHLILLKIQNMININVYLLHWFTKFLIRKLQAVILKIRIGQTKNYQKSCIKSIIRKIEKRKVHSFFIYSTWGADLADI